MPLLSSKINSSPRYQCLVHENSADEKKLSTEFYANFQSVCRLFCLQIQFYPVTSSIFFIPFIFFPLDANSKNFSNFSNFFSFCRFDRTNFPLELFFLKIFYLSKKFEKFYYLMYEVILFLLYIYIQLITGDPDYIREIIKPTTLTHTSKLIKYYKMYQDNENRQVKEMSLLLKITTILPPKLISSIRNIFLHCLINLSIIFC